jgi:beta-glucosidase
MPATMAALYQDTTRSIADRAKDLLARMNLDEKIAQLHAFWLLLSEDGKHKVRDDVFAGASDPAKVTKMLSHGLGQISRPLGSHAVEPRKGVRALNRLQRFLVEETRLGIPAIAHEEVLVGLMVQGATLFPSALAFGATWNPELVEQAARAIGTEARSIGCRQGLAPVLDVSRDVRWGRTEETFGEDAYLVGLLGTSYVKGLQGEKRDLLATLKHYAGHSSSEGGRNHAPVHMGWRELNDVFLLPFEMAVKEGDARSVMPAYHDLDGEPGHASHLLLTEVLRERWGFDGLVVADYIGVTLLHQHHGVAADATEAAVLAFRAGLDIETPGDDCAPSLRSALERGLFTMDELDAIVLRVLTEKLRMGLFERPYADEGAIELQAPATIAVSKEVARQSVVLLENRGALPLDPGRKQKVAVIGPTADDPLAMLCGYSFPVHLIISGKDAAAAGVVTPRAALERALGKDQVTYAQGCHILEKRDAGAPVFPGDVDLGSKLERTSPVSQARDLIPQAVACAKAADLAVVFVGDLAGLFQTGTVGEGSDADSLDLPGVQQELLEAVVAAGKPVIVAMTGGRPYGLGGLEAKVAGFLWAFQGGQEGGTAIAEVLTGAIEPTGRLSVSFPKNVGAAPYTYDHKLKSAGTPIAFHFGTRYPFGHGLSYTRFEYRDLSVAPGPIDIESGDLRVRFTVANVGARAGVAVPQLYVRDLLASMVRPVRQLKAFGRVTLQPGQSAQVEMTVPVDMLHFTGSDGARRIEPGEFELQVGPSSADLPLRTTVRVGGEIRRLGRAWRMTSRCKVV